MSHCMRRRTFLRIAALLAGNGALGQLLAACAPAPVAPRTQVATRPDSTTPTRPTRRCIFCSWRMGWRFRRFARVAPWGRLESCSS
jgi:hypothetical protein